MLIAATHWRIQPFCQRHGTADGTTDHNTGTIQDDRECGLGQHFCRGIQRIITA